MSAPAKPFIAILMIFSFTTHAQDTLYMKNGSIQIVKVKQETSTRIRYYDWNGSNISTSVSRDDVVRVAYKSGTSGQAVTGQTTYGTPDTFFMKNGSIQIVTIKEELSTKIKYYPMGEKIWMAMSPNDLLRIGYGDPNRKAPVWVTPTQPMQKAAQQNAHYQPPVIEQSIEKKEPVENNQRPIQSKGTALLKAGTAIPVKVTSTYSTKSSSPPQLFVASNVEDHEGNVLIQAGTMINITAGVQRARGVGKPGELHVNIVSTTASDGQLVPLFGAFEKVGKSKKGTAHGTTWALFFLVMGPLALPCLAIKGEDAEIMAGSVVTYANVAQSIHVRVE